MCTLSRFGKSLVSFLYIPVEACLYHAQCILEYSKSDVRGRERGRKIDDIYRIVESIYSRALRGDLPLSHFQVLLESTNTFLAADYMK